MKPEKPTENWTKYPNNILDNIDKFDGNEFKVLSLMIRKNIGYENPNREFSANYIVMKIKISKPTVIKCLNNLKERGTIKIIGVGKRGVFKYQVCWDKPLVKNFN